MSTILLKGGRIIDPSQSIDKVTNLFIENNKISSITDEEPSSHIVIDASGKVVCPGFIDMHVHLREPGREDKEDLKHGVQAAVWGAFTTICTMANTDQPIDNEASVSFIKYKAKSLNLAKVEPICAVTKGLNGEELTNFYLTSQAGAVAFSDDGKSIMDSNLMLKALQYSRLVDKRIISHAEDSNLTRDGIVNEGEISLLTGLKGIPSVAEEIIVIRDILLAGYAKSKLHIAHVTTSGSVDLIKWGKKKGIDVTCEVTPHHLILTDEQLTTYDARFKVNPPLRAKKDAESLIQAINDGVIDVIASDHAPHTIDEKEDEIHLAPFGIVGLETVFGLLNKYLVEPKKVALNKIIQLLTSNPAKVLNMDDRGSLKPGSTADVVVLDTEAKWIVDTSKFKSKCRVSPYSNFDMKGRVVTVIIDGGLKMNMLATKVNKDAIIEEIHLNDWS
ncbi:MAG: dihydroorotase [Planctomycetes bacterium]|nr:dihydroorotase [Planctomycetota bacterium]